MIQLATPIIESGFPLQPNINDAQAAVVNIAPDPVVPATQCVITFRYGNGTQSGGHTTGFTPDLGTREIDVFADCVAATWSAPGMGGSLTGPQVTAVQNLLNTILAAANKNAVEGFAVAVNLFGAGCSAIPW